MKVSILFACALLSLTSCASTSGDVASSSPDKSAAPSPTTLAQFEHLKDLAGDWYEQDGDGNPSGDLTISYRVSSNGSAVIETTFPGGDSEMTTVYGLDQSDLVLTHYCALGNAPSMRAETANDANGVHFECTGVGNVASHDDKHMHDAKFTFEKDGRLRSVWGLWLNGEIVNEVNFELVRG